MWTVGSTIPFLYMWKKKLIFLDGSSLSIFIVDGCFISLLHYLSVYKLIALECLLLIFLLFKVK